MQEESFGTPFLQRDIELPSEGGSFFIPQDLIAYTG